MSTDGETDKEDGVYTQWNTTQPQKEQNNAICSSMDEPRDYHKSDRWTNNIMIPLMCEILKKRSQTQRNRRHSSGCQGIGRQKNGELFDVYRVSVLLSEKVLQISYTPL